MQLQQRIGLLLLLFVAMQQGWLPDGIGQPSGPKLFVGMREAVNQSPEMAAMIVEVQTTDRIDRAKAEIVFYDPDMQFPEVAKFVGDLKDKSPCVGVYTANGDRLLEVVNMPMTAEEFIQLVAKHAK